MNITKADVLHLVFEDNIEIELFGQIVLFGRKVVFACQNLPSFTLGVEICEDLWLPNAPSNELALNGATVICNTSASNELTAQKRLSKKPCFNAISKTCFRICL